MLGIFKHLFGQSETSELTEAITKGAFLVDVRTPAEFAEGSVSGAVNISLEKIPFQLATFKGKNPIVVFCRSGNRSGEAKRILEKYGFRNIINGGTWQQVKQAKNKSTSI